MFAKWKQSTSTGNTKALNKLRGMALFVRLADLGSFTRVAEQNNTSKSMISKEIGRLEDELGVRLLHRTTRNVQLTHAGEAYLQRARKILADINEADAFVQSLQQTPRGKLRINAPMVLGITDLADMFADFMRQFPDIDLDIHLGDEDVDLVEQGFDLGFRAASHPFDSSYVGRPLTTFQYRICASRRYLDRYGSIEHPKDLLHHNCFEYAYFKGKNVWPIEDGIPIKGSLRVNSTLFMLEAIKADQGVGFLPDFVCRDALKNGEVVEVLKDVQKPSLTLYALYPARHFVPATVIQCIAFLEQWFSEP
ncbi:LysR family transcriptional regulator [Photobacterium sp. CCB-ST2H9]|uniref:LysR family transcriptional regulator n=1 Tax=Photobacterium sp. CCB-ST2H9 TaxID=2912855 RepID=UPI002004C437|nr:LysR substrate-binding domain-containing protein [Photobacterium sp. CCB-ST2H9]UTM59367.1 LysR family transcriptional regulator [Photobacterium sp. CCB-ST2H9]